MCRTALVSVASVAPLPRFPDPSTRTHPRPAGTWRSTPRAAHSQAEAPRQPAPRALRDRQAASVVLYSAMREASAGSALEESVGRARRSISGPFDIPTDSPRTQYRLSGSLLDHDCRPLLGTRRQHYSLSGRFFLSRATRKTPNPNSPIENNPMEKTPTEKIPAENTLIAKVPAVKMSAENSPAATTPLAKPPAAKWFETNWPAE